MNRAVIIPAVIPCGRCDACLRGKATICPNQKMPGNDIHGGFATHITVPARGLCVVDEHRLAAVGIELADLSVIADAREHAGKMQASAASFAGPLLESIQFVRQYAGPPLAEGRKSVSFRLTVGSAERTLSSDEVGEIRARIIDGMRGLGYELRV